MLKDKRLTVQRDFKSPCRHKLIFQHVAEEEHHHAGVDLPKTKVSNSQIDCTQLNISLVSFLNQQVTLIHASVSKRLKLALESLNKRPPRLNTFRRELLSEAH